MDDASKDIPSGARTDASGRSAKGWLVLVATGIAAGVIAWLLGTVVIPRWWAQRIGNIIDGRITAGTVFGLCAGALFSVVPLTILAVGWRFRKGWRRLLLFAVLALLTAAPNLATLGIVLGDGNAAHAGERILDVDGPGFRGGSLVGAVIGAACFAAVGLLASSRRRNRITTKRLKAELADRPS